MLSTSPKGSAVLPPLRGSDNALTSSGGHGSYNSSLSNSNNNNGTVSIFSLHENILLDPEVKEIRVDAFTLLNLAKKHNSKIINALELEQQRADVTELLRSAQRTQKILGKCATEFGDLSGTNVKVVELLYNELCKYEKKIEQLQHIGTLVRFITQSRLRSKLDQLSNYICSQTEALEKYIKEFKITQIVGDSSEEIVSLWQELGKKDLEKIDFTKLEFKRSLEALQNIKDEDIKSKVSTTLSIVKTPEKKQTLLSSIVSLKVKPISTDIISDLVVVASKSNDESEQTAAELVSAKSISTYPTILETGQREGDPICDQYAFYQSDARAIAVLADGCSWGEEPKEAARKASKIFVAYLKRYEDMIQTTSDAANFILQAFEAAHNTIIYGRNSETLYMAGTTTLLGGVILELVTPENGMTHVFVCASIGDCKAFCYKAKSDTVEEITVGNRGGIDARDPGGRIGPTLNGGAPDLRNLILYSYLCCEGDILFIVSDGVHDNLDPRQVGKLPQEIGLKRESKNWDFLKEDKDAFKAEISAWTMKYLDNLLTRPVTVSSITQSLIKNSAEITSAMRNWMEQNPGKKIPPNYTLYPGKVDHTTCISFKVSPKKNWTTAKTPPTQPAASSPKPTPISSVGLSTSTEELQKVVEEERDQFSGVWDKLFGHEVYVLEWDQFAKGLTIPLDVSSERQLKMILDNSNTGSVNRFKFSEFLKGFGPLEECLNNVNKVVNAPWFFGFISASEGKKFLELSTVGTFLVRFSGSKPGSFVLDYVQKTGQVRSVRLNGHLNGGFAAMSEDGSKELVFKGLHEVVETYKSKNVLSVPFSSSLPNKPWFFGDLTSEESDQLLQGHSAGTFLLRFSSRPGCFAASFVATDGSVKRGLLTKHPAGYQVEGAGPVYPTLEDIVQFYLDSGIFKTPCIIDSQH